MSPNFLCALYVDLLLGVGHLVVQSLRRLN